MTTKSIVQNQTIFAPATPPGKSGVAVIRISGEQASSVFTSLTGKTTPTSHHAKVATLANPENGDIIDQALVIWFEGPRSFTGEDTLELHLHGSRAVLQDIMEVLSSMSDLRLAEPGEFSKRAFENGKMDLTQAEGLADLIEAETSIQKKQAIRQMQGELENLYEKWRTKLIAILAQVEAYIDFPDEELPAELVTSFSHDISQLADSLAEHLDDDHRGERLRDGIYTAILGAPNVGKSSLINALAKREVAIVSDIAGTTRDVLEVHLDLDGLPVTLADTAGLRETEDHIEIQGVKRAHDRARQADLKLVMFDASELPTLDDSTTKLIDEQSIVLINKSDVASADTLPKEIAGHTPIILSIAENEGLNQLLDQLQTRASNMIAPSSDPVITRTRHRNCVQNCLTILQGFSVDKPYELIGEDLRQAADQLGQLTGHIDVEDILDALFSEFCIGK